MVRPETRGVKCFITHSDGTILLVRLNYGQRHWTLPGGGVDQDESLAAAAARELWEEAGIAVPTLTEIFTYQNRTNYKHNTVTVFSGTTDSKDVTIDPIEIAQSGWFPTDDLPSPLAPSVRQILAATP